MDRQTHDNIYRASIASRGKNATVIIVQHRRRKVIENGQLLSEVVQVEHTSVIYVLQKNIHFSYSNAIDINGKITT